MYGERRIVVARDGRVSLQGSSSGRGGSFHPMGNVGRANKGWSAFGLKDEGEYGKVYVGTYSTRDQAKNALLQHYKSTTRYIA
jgi:hypothetical protein